MCGIVGARHDWLLRQGLDPDAAMRAAVDALAWRGPDGRAVVQAGPWWLGCARLAITQPNSSQPVVRRGGRFAAVLNGAITNARALWSELLPRAERRPAPPNDAWLPLLAVANRRGESLAALRGHHAFAVVDVATGELVFGQDRWAEKPLCCFVERIDGRPTLVAFASTAPALGCLGIPLEHSARRLSEWFRYGWSAARPHRFDARRSLTTVPQRGVPLTTGGTAFAWCAPWQPAAATPNVSATADLRRCLTDSVARCLDTTVPVALSLSGGIDSSCLALALRDLGRALPAYQFRAAGAPAAERSAARAAAQRAGLLLIAVDGGPEVLDALPHLTQVAGQPLGDPSLLAVHAVARRAAADGVRVMLGGEGADELLLGYRRYRVLARLPRLPALARFAPRWSMASVARLMRAVVADDPAAALLAVTPPAFADAVLAAGLGGRRCWTSGAFPAITTSLASPPQRSKIICVAASRPGKVEEGSTPLSNR
jgi:asparagine synthase (glutamine-hydrolysing)